jgi:hypothetical protein
MSEFEESVELIIGEGEGDVIEGGEVTDADTLVETDLKQAQALTTRRLAYLLVILMAASVVGHYIAVVILVLGGNQEAVSMLSDVFTTWLPVISGLAGSAVTYYFTREN